MVPACEKCSAYWWLQASKHAVAIRSSRTEEHGAAGAKNSTTPAQLREAFLEEETPQLG